jgi:hypothetical protein
MEGWNGQNIKMQVSAFTSLTSLSRFHLFVGGGQNIINATKDFHGPSWRMIVQLTDKIEAMVFIPGDKVEIPAVNIMIHLLINGPWKILFTLVHACR